MFAPSQPWVYTHACPMSVRAPLRRFGSVRFSPATSFGFCLATVGSFLRAREKLLLSSAKQTLHRRTQEEGCCMLGCVARDRGDGLADVRLTPLPVPREGMAADGLFCPACLSFCRGGEENMKDTCDHSVSRGSPDASSAMRVELEESESDDPPPPQKNK